MEENNIEMPKVTRTTVTATFTRQIQPKQYETASAGLTMVKEFDGDLTATQVDLVAADMETLLKQQVFAQLGIKAEVNEEGILMEIARVFPGAKTSNGDAGPFGDDDDDEEERPRPRTNRGGGGRSGGRSSGGSGKISSKDAEKMWEDFMGDSKNDFYDNLDGEYPNIKHKKSGQKLYLKYAPQWVKDELED